MSDAFFVQRFGKQSVALTCRSASAAGSPLAAPTWKRYASDVRELEVGSALVLEGIPCTIILPADVCAADSAFELTGSVLCVGLSFGDEIAESVKALGQPSECTKHVAPASLAWSACWSSPGQV